MSALARCALVLTMTVLLIACGGSTPTDPTPAPVPRPSSPAKIEIVSPMGGEVVQGPSVVVTVAIQDAHIVEATTLNIKPDEGHVHLFIDNNIVRMGYTLSQTFSLKPATYTMYAEFVAADHVYFNPRVTSNRIVFTVK